MSINGKIRLLQLTGSVADIATVTQAQFVAGKLVGAGQSQLDPNRNGGQGDGNFNLPQGFSMENLNLDAHQRASDASGVMQLLADGLGKITGRADWTNSTPGTLEFGDRANTGQRGGNTLDIKLIQNSPDQQIKLDSAGQLKLGSDKILSVGSNKPGGDAIEIRSGGDARGPGTHGDGVNAGGIKIAAQARLLLSSSHSIEVESASTTTGPMKITQKSSSRNIQILSLADGPGALVLSASGGSSPTIRVQAARFEWMSIGDASNGATEAELRVGSHGPYPAVGIGGPQTNQNVTLYAGSGGGQLKLSGSDASAAIGFSCGDTGAEYPQSQGPGGLALYNGDDEAKAFVTAFNNTTSILGAIKTNADNITSASEPTLFSKFVDSPDNPIVANTAIEVPRAGTGSKTNLGGYKTNSVQVILNGQVLTSASGGSVGDVTPDGDYAIVGDGTANQIKFGFTIEDKDVVRGYYFG